LATARPSRPRSPHLFNGPMRLHYVWGPHMTVSILHRATGSGMATVGTVLLVWWLAAAAAGAESYASFVDLFTTDTGALNIVGWVLGVGLSWAFFQHMANGIRHLFMDVGANYELKRNKASAIATLVFAPLATVALWAYIVWGR
jgi:succinate dehydrogenase / fumarate reductase, cytochrome b subunit